MSEWEQELVRHQLGKKEIYGRYIDDIFMITNESFDGISEQLKRASHQDVNIKIEYRIATSIDFLDVSITNVNGRLKTSVYHKSAAEPYILPFTSDHPRLIHRNIPYAALLRATPLCSNVEDFHAECTRSDVSLLLNDYPPTLISKQRDRFFQMNNAMSVWDVLDEQDYHRLRCTLLHKLTNREKILMVMTEDPIRNPTVLQQKTWDASMLYPRYLFDSSNAVGFQERFYVCWATNDVLKKLE